MKTVYQTTNTTDAHVVSNLLAQSGINAQVVGQEMGPYTHALGAVRVVVEPGEEAEARGIVTEWERRAAEDQSKLDGQRIPLTARLSRDALLLVAGLVVLFAMIWYFTGGPGARA